MARKFAQCVAVTLCAVCFLCSSVHAGGPPTDTQAYCAPAPCPPPSCGPQAQCGPPQQCGQGMFGAPFALGGGCLGICTNLCGAVIGIPAAIMNGLLAPTPRSYGGASAMCAPPACGPMPVQACAPATCGPPMTCPPPVSYCAPPAPQQVLRRRPGYWAPY
jgi:hypothetical protein